MKNASRITIAVNPNESYLRYNLSADGTYTISGFEGRFLQIAMSALGIPYNLVFPEDGLLGEEISPGNWTGMMGLIQRGEADLAFTHLPINYQRTKLVDFSRYYCMEEYTFVSQYPETTKSAFTFLHPFNLPIWTCILVSLVIVSVCFAMLKNGTSSVPEALFQLFPSIVGQPLNVGRNSLKCNILITFWGFFAKFILFCYTSILLSFLIQPLKESPIRNFHELSKEIHVRRHKYFYNEESINFLRSSPEKYLSDIGEILHRINRFDYFAQLFSGQLNDVGSSIGMSRSNAQVFFAGKKGIYFAEDNLFSTAIAFACSKNFCCRSRLDTIISRLSNSGIYEKFLRDHSRNIPKSARDDFVNYEVVKPLALSDLFGTLLILVAGIALSFIFLLGEIIYFKFSSHK